MPAKIRDSDGNWLAIGDRMIRVAPGGGACVVPIPVGATKATASEIHFDNAHILRELVFETGGAVRIEFWRSVNSPDPVNQVAIDTAIDAQTTPPEPDLSNIKWLFVGEQPISEPGHHPSPPGLIGAIRGSRYLKVDRTYGASLTIHALSAGA